MRTLRCALFGLVLAVLLFTGCRSVRQTGSDSHAAVRIQGRSTAEIQQAVTVVFGEKGYRLTMSTPQALVFERPGSRYEAIKWGDLGGSGVNLRVKVQCSEGLGGSRLLEADAYAVQVSDEPFFQTESRNLLLNCRPYQRLLDELAARLK